MQGLSLFTSRRRNIFLYVCTLAVPIVFLAAMLSQSVLAQNTFVITDGDQVIVHTTYASDPATALDEAGVDADPDEYSATLSEDGVYDIKVIRDDTVTVVNCGETMELPVTDSTVGGLLKRAGIPTGDEYVISCDLSAQPQDGMTITVDHEVTQEEIYTVDVPFETTTVEDPYLPKGDEKVITEGELGQILYTADVTYRNAEEVSRKIRSGETIKQAQNRVVAIGTGKEVGKKAKKPLIGDGVIVLPSGEVLTYYKKDTYKATAYTQYDEGCNDTTACMTKVKWGVVAVDTDLIPYGTRMFIVNKKGNFIYGIGTAEDCGGGIQFGIQDVNVYFLGDANWTY